MLLHVRVCACVCVHVHHGGWRQVPTVRVTKKKELP